MLSNHLTLSHPLLLLPSILPVSGFFPMSRFFASSGQNIGASVSASVLPVNIQGWFFFRIYWFDLLAVQGTLKSLLQHHSSKRSILWHSAFFMVQLSHPYMTSGKSIALTICTFVGKLMSLLFNGLPRFVIAFLPKCKYLLLSWTVTIWSDFGAQETEVCHCFHLFPIYLPWNDGTWCHDL